MQAEDGIRDLVRSRGLGDVYKRQMEYFRNLKDRGKTAELVFYPREGHGLGEYYHQADLSLIHI